MTIQNTLLLIFSFAINAQLLADVQVTMREDEGGESVIKLSRDWARIHSAAMSGNYMLVDMKKQQSYIVDEQRKMLIKIEDMPGMLAGMKNHSGMRMPEVSVVEAGAGPKVAGYPTRRYVLKVEGQVCSEHFISKGPLEVPEIKQFSHIMEKQADMDMGMPDSACEYAENEFDKRAFEYGVPMLSRDAAGNETFRIMNINTRARFSTKELARPVDYKEVSQRQLMEQEMKRAMRDLPSETDMQKMGEQMQQHMQQFEEMFQPRAEN